MASCSPPQHPMLWIVWQESGRFANCLTRQCSGAWIRGHGVKGKSLMDKNQSTGLLFEMSRPGRRTHLLPDCDVPAPAADELLPRDALAAAPPPLPEGAEIDLIRHFVNLSTRNMSIG